MKKRILFLFVLTVIGQLANAQENPDKKSYVAKDRAYHAEDEVAVHKRGWIRSHLFDDWFMDVQGGGQLYYGTDDRKGAFKDRLTGNAELHVGRRIFPMFGFRLSAGLGAAHGFLTKEHYGRLEDHGGYGVSGSDASGNPLKGYYYDYNEDLFIQKWRYYYFGGDLFVDLGLLKSVDLYNSNVKYNNILYLGVFNRISTSETDSKNHRSELHLGYIFKYNFNHNWSILADIRGSFIERLFDREWVPGVEPSGFSTDYVLNAQLGICYRFHIRDENQRNTFNRKDDRRPKSNTLAYITYVRMEDTVVLRSIDTLLVQRSIHTPTPETQELIDSLQQSINDKLNRDKERAMFMPLDSILINSLLPYEMVFFELDKWDILASEEMKIEKMARIMQAYPDETFILTGSADLKTGTKQRNDFLSERRANVVYDKLIFDYGISPERLKREYLGGIDDYKPFQLNRCTVIILDHPAVRKAFNEMKAQNRANK